MIFYGDVILRWKNKKNRFYVEQDFLILWNHRTFVVPKGFDTDLASIPRWATPFIPKLGHHLHPAVAHDYLYRHHSGYTRKEADLMFLAGMKEQGVGRIRAQVMYRAVRIGGGKLWK